MVSILINVSILFLFCTSHESAAQPYKTLVTPITKDTKTSLYTITLNSRKRYLIDLDAAFSWQLCPSYNHPPVGCFTSACIQATYLPSSSCSLLPDTSRKPCTCTVTPINPIAKSCALAPLISDKFTIYSTNGANPTSITTFANIYLSCAPSSLFKSLPRGVFGLASLSRAALGLPSQFSQSSLGVSNKFALCLPSLGNGVAFFGDGPYNLLPPTNFDVSSYLSYTPLLINPKSADFFIGIKALSISGNSFPMSPFEGVKLSTTVPYTTLRSDIYKFLVKNFIKGMEGIPKVKKVQQFSTCFNASMIGFSRVGLHVPQIDLEFDNGENWTIYGANSMKLVGEDSACFAFLDGGKMPEHSIVIGSFQMLDNFLLFDIDQSRLGFSSSLLFERITCSGFNFTTKA